MLGPVSNQMRPAADSFRAQNTIVGNKVLGRNAVKGRFDNRMTALDHLDPYRRQAANKPQVAAASASPA